MREVIVHEFTAREDRVDEREADFRAVAHGDRGGAIEFHDGRTLDSQKDIVNPHNLAPIGRGSGRRFGMHGRNGGLQRVRAEPSRRQGFFDERKALLDLFTIP